MLNTLLKKNKKKLSLLLDHLIISHKNNIKNHLIHINQVQFIQVSGEEVFVMVKAQWSGLMVVVMRVTGRTIELVDRGSSRIRMETHMRDNGIMIRLMD